MRAPCAEAAVKDFMRMTAPREIEKVLCPRCQAELDAGDRFCRHCGAPQGDAAGDPAASDTAAPGRPARQPESRGTLLLALFALVGPVALPALWRSPRFSRPWKIVLTVLVSIQTVLVVWLAWYVLHRFLFEPLQRLREL
jgi:ribosomal protein L40E